MGRITLRLSDELELELQRQAKDKGITMAEHCRNILSGQTTTAKENFDNVNDRLTNSAKEFHKVCEAVNALKNYISGMGNETQPSSKDLLEIKARVENIWSFLSAVNSNIESIDNGYKRNSQNLATMDNDILKLSYFVRRIFEELEKQDNNKSVRDILQEMDMAFNANERPTIFPNPKNWK